MKIAILTQPLHTNYGGILQAYALQTFLQNYGHEVIVVNREYYWSGGNKLTIRNLFLRIGSFIKTLIRVYLLHYDGYVVMNPFSPYYHSVRSEVDPLPFVKEYIRQSPEIRTSEKLKKYIQKQKFDVYIVGSDQVWRPCYSPCITDFFLKQLPSNTNAKRIAYAASFGTDVWEYSLEETEECAMLVKRFNAISVRECSGVKLCKEYLDVEAVHMLDPTFMLNVEDYIALIERSKVPKSSGDVFCYILDDNSYSDIIISAIEKDGLTPFYAGLDPNRYDMSVEQWLRGFYDAKLVITDSFHACVFSILFGKPFVVMRNIERGTARLDSLLGVFDMQDRAINSFEEFIRIKTQLLSPLKHRDISLILSQWRTSAREFFYSVNLIP